MALVRLAAGNDKSASGLFVMTVGRGGGHRQIESLSGLSVAGRGSSKQAVHQPMAEFMSIPRLPDWRAFFPRMTAPMDGISHKATPAVTL